MKTDTKKIRALFVGEAVTAAHVIRPLGLAREMDRSRYDTVMACDRRCKGMVEAENVAWRELPSIANDVFTKRLMQGTPLYTLAELDAYVRDDLKLIGDVRPDVIVGDFRISMSLAAKWSGIPYWALSNAHWSPAARLPMPTPDHTLIGLLGVQGWRCLLKATLPFFLAWQARAYNKLCRRYGIEPVRGQGAPEVYTRGARTLYLDMASLYPEIEFGANETCIGPVLWAPCPALPAWWDLIPQDKPVAFMSAGSSGSVSAMRQAITAVAGMGYTVLAATAGKMKAAELPSGVYAANFLPGLQAAARSDLVVCNGGSGLVYQALAHGKPVLGIPTNMDQWYVMEAVGRQGAGAILRTNAVSERLVRQTVTDLLENTDYRVAAQRMARELAARNPAEQLQRMIRATLENGSERGPSNAPVRMPDRTRWSRQVPGSAGLSLCE